MSDDAIFPASYAACLVQRARDGMTFDQMRPTTRWSTPSYEWRQVKPSEHWRAWYRETKSAFFLTDNTHVEIGLSDTAYMEATIELWLMLHAYSEALNTLGYLCPSPLELRHCPEEWTRC